MLRKAIEKLFFPERELLREYKKTRLKPDEIEKLHKWYVESLKRQSELAAELKQYRKLKEEGRLKILELSDEPGEGLKRKYIVFKARNGEPVENAFVLRPDKDPAAWRAVFRYAITTDNRELRQDMMSWLSEIERVAGAGKEEKGQTLCP